MSLFLCFVNWSFTTLITEYAIVLTWHFYPKEVIIHLFIYHFFLKQFEIFKVGVPNYIYIKWHLKWCVWKPLSHISLSILQDVCSVFKSICGILPLTDILSFENNICRDWNLEVFQRSICRLKSILLYIFLVFVCINKTLKKKQVVDVRYQWRLKCNERWYMVFLWLSEQDLKST